jgi:hypothetical protein
MCSTRVGTYLTGAVIHAVPIIMGLQPIWSYKVMLYDKAENVLKSFNADN